VDALHELANQNPQAASESILGMSFDEVLSRFGRPTTIQPTRWWYCAVGHSGFNLNFVNGFVGGMSNLHQ
jgi:hypothetical protein